MGFKWVSFGSTEKQRLKEQEKYNRGFYQTAGELLSGRKTLEQFNDVKDTSSFSRGVVDAVRRYRAILTLPKKITYL